MSELTVVIPTFRRPEGLHRAARSVLAQANAPKFEILIVDNDPAASSKDVAENISALSPDGVRVRYVHEPAAGVANARNTAMENVTTDLVAFLDDDQSVPDNWLAEFSAFHTRTPAPVTFGPVVTELPETTQKHRSYLEDFFARKLDIPSGLIQHYYGCGNALLDLSRINMATPLFDVSMNETGGEDDILFQSILEKGGKFGWCAEAPAYEHVPETRARLGYTLKRAFGYGQGPVTLARKSVPKQYGKIVIWMAIGAGKALLNGVLYLGHLIVRSPSRAIYLDRAVRGLGKVFWWVNLTFYGAGSLPDS